jgi:hypothetical protein
MNSAKTSFEKDDKVVWCPHGANTNYIITKSTLGSPSTVIINPTTSPLVNVASTITTNSSSNIGFTLSQPLSNPNWSQPQMCTGFGGHTSPPRRGLDGVVLDEGTDRWDTPYAQVQFSDGWVEKIPYPESKLRPLSGCDACPYRLYRITAECPNDPDLVKK